MLADVESVFDRLLTAVERSLADPADRMVIIEAATQVAVTVARVVSLAAVQRASRDRASRLREEMAQRQLREVLGRQHASISRLALWLSPVMTFTRKRFFLKSRTCTRIKFGGRPRASRTRRPMVSCR